MFWDIFGPLFLLLFIGLIVWAAVGYLQKDLYPLIVGGFAELLLCFMLGWSIGKLIVLIPLIQFGLAGYIIYDKIQMLKERTE